MNQHFLAGWLVVLVLTLGASQARAQTGGGMPPPSLAGLVWAAGTNLQSAVDAAPPHAVLMCDRSQCLTLASPVIIRKPLTIRGLNARLPEKLGNTSLIVVRAEGVTFSDFELCGNGDSVAQKDRAPLMSVQVGGFVIERGLFQNSSKDGVEICPPEGSNSIVGGVVRDIVGRAVIRDVVSISGGSAGKRVRNVLVENIRGSQSELRGVVEVSDGTDNITVRTVYAEQCVYAIDVQDHHVAGQSNRNVLIEDVYAVGCKHALRTANSALGHAHLTLRDITAERCTQPLQISFTEAVTLQNLRVLDHQGRKTPMAISNCDGVCLRDVLIQNTEHNGAALLLQDCNDVLVDGFEVRGNAEKLSNGILYRLSKDRAFSGLRIRNAFVPALAGPGIELKRAKNVGTLSDYIISGNIARIEDNLRGTNAVVFQNVPEPAKP